MNAAGFSITRQLALQPYGLQGERGK